MMSECQNRSSENKFFIMGFSSPKSVEYVQVLGILLLYLWAALGNIVIVGLVVCMPQLHTPMYFFLCNLSIVDVTYVSNTLPKLLSITLTHDHSISYLGCIIQEYFFMFCTAAEIFMLTTMAYDRYVAICFALQYSLVISKNVCITMAACSWFASALNSVLHIVLTTLLSFCHSHEINHFFCEMKALLRITSSDTTSRELLLTFENIFLALPSFTVTIISYIYIISTILKVQSLAGRLKAFSRCTSHITTVLLFYGPGIFLYMKPQTENSQEQDKLISMFYVAVVPMLNPLVYSLRNEEVLGAIKKLSITKRKGIYI